jgi:hypothetical protein
MESRPGQKVGKTVIPGFARAAILATVVAGAACTDSTGPAVRVSIVPAAPTVALQSSPQGQVLKTSVTLANSSRYAVAYTSCGITLEKAGMPQLPPGKSDWEPVWHTICYVLDINSVASSATSPSVGAEFVGTVLQPGESVTLSVVALVGQPVFPDFTGEPGLYRFHVPLSARIVGAYRPIPYELSVSDSFALLPVA